MSTSVQPPEGPGATRPGLSSTAPLDVVVGGAALLARAAAGAGRLAGAVLQPLTRVALTPRGVPRQLQPARLLEAVARAGALRQAALRAAMSRQLDVLVPEVIAELLGRADPTHMLLKYVDLDAVVAAVDLDAAVGRVDLDAVAARVNVGDVVDRVDVEAVLDRLDLTSVILQRVDLDVLVDAILTRVDIDAVAQRLDLDAVLDRLDLTSVVLQRVDLDVLVPAIIAHIDLVGLAEDVIDAVDLPEIIRESTGSMASDTVRGARMQGIAADEAVGRAVDRILLRRGRRSTQAPGRAGPTDEPGSGPIPPQSDHRR